MPEEDNKKLEKLRRELYAKDETEEIKMRRQSIRQLGSPTVNVGAKKEETDTGGRFYNLAGKQAARRRKAFWIGGSLAGLVVIFIAVVIVTFQFRASRQVTEDQIGISFEGPADVQSGEEVVYTIRYRNDSRVVWENVEIAAELPEELSVTETDPAAEMSGRQAVYQHGRLASGEEASILVRGRLVGEEGQVVVMQAAIMLTPENFPSGRFSKTAIVPTTLTAMPISVAIDAAQTAAPRERIRAVIVVRNLGNRAIEEAVLNVTPSPGIELSTEDPEFSSGFSAVTSSWDLGELPPLGETTRTLILFAEGQPGERRPINVEIGVRRADAVLTQRRVTHVVTISASELTIEQIYNDTTEPQTVFPEGEVVGVIRYRNTGTAGMRDVVVTVQFEGAGFDPGSLQLAGGRGAYDPRTNTITWTSATVPELSVLDPGETGNLEFNFDILPVAEFPVEGDSASNVALVSTATIDSQDLKAPAGQEQRVISDRAVLAIGTNLSVDVTAFYDDGRLGIQSTGPNPPRVGETTTYTVRARAGSTLNDAGDVRLLAVLPDGVEYTGQAFVTSGNVEFNDRAREVTWRMPLLPALTGRTRPAEELHFQIAVTPGENLRGRVITFLNRLVADGQDLFVDQLVTTEITEFPSTQDTATGGGQVE